MRLSAPQAKELHNRYRCQRTTCLILWTLLPGRQVRCRSLIRLGLINRAWELTTAGFSEGDRRWGEETECYGGPGRDFYSEGIPEFRSMASAPATKEQEWRFHLFNLDSIPRRYDRMRKTVRYIHNWGQHHDAD